MLVALIVSLVLSVATFAMSLFGGSAKAPNVEDKSLEVPTSEIGTSIPVLFGKARLPVIIAWYGDLAIKKVKVSTAGKK
jgi:hypothetical protein